MRGLKNASTPALRIKLIGAAPAAVIHGDESLPAKVHYLRGNDPQRWHTNVPTYARVRIDGIYPGIDLTYYGTDTSDLEFDFVVAPRADPAAVRLAFEGADRLRITDQGELVLGVGGGELRLPKPVIYQYFNGERRLIGGGYVHRADEQIAFEVDSYDTETPLVIDPTLIYSTYLGGSSEEHASGIAVDAAGHAYVAGMTNSPGFLTRSALDTDYDVLVVKLNPAGSALVYATYVGGSNVDAASAIAVDTAGHAFVTGSTHSRDFPVVTPMQSAAAGGEDAYIFKLDPTGALLLYSTYVGGREEEGALDLALDVGGNAYIAGYTSSADFPTTNAAQAEFGGGDMDAFATTLNAAGTAIVYSTYLGGREADVARSVAVDGAGNAYVSGTTVSSNFPTAAARQPALAGGADAFITKLNPTGSALVYSTFLGGSEADESSAIAVDGAGNAYVTGVTTSPDFPTVNAVQAEPGGGPDAFISKLNQSGGALVYSTYFGGGAAEAGPYLAVDGAGYVYLAGSTESSDFPIVSAIQAAFGRVKDMFVAKLRPGGDAFDYATYLGGSSMDGVSGIAVDPNGAAYITGSTTSTDFPTRMPAQASSGGRRDAVIVKVQGS